MDRSDEKGENSPSGKRSAIYHGDGNQKKKQVLLLTDSHGRKIGRLLQEKLGQRFHVLSFVKLNATFENVVDHITSFGEHLTEDDYLILYAGSNNFKKENLLSSPVEIDIGKLADVAKKTNIIYPGIPFRFDVLHLNGYIADTNAQIHKSLTGLAMGNPNVVLPRNWIFDRSDFTCHGLHYNYYGKMKLATYMAYAILSDIDSKEQLKPEVVKMTLVSTDTSPHRHLTLALCKRTADVEPGDVLTKVGNEESNELNTSNYR